MDPYLNDWLNFLLRWLHVIAAIAWIGASFYFIYLDMSLRRPLRRADEEMGVGGEFWAVHGGGFYHTQKYVVAPRTLPEPLHWFKWEAYTTWLSGFALFVLLYYLNADTYLVDRSVADLSEGVAVALSVGGLVLAWIVYDLLCRLLGANDAVLAVAVAAFTVGAAYAATNLFSGRAAFLQVGAMLGTMMAGNVLFNIIPAHWELVRAKQAAREPDPGPGIRAKQRSVHNNYLTLPVVFAMVSNHFPIAYGHRHAWLVLLAFMTIGAWIRHYFNLRHRGRNALWIPATAVVALVALALAIQPEEGSGGSAAGDDEPVAFADVEPIVDERCAACHSAEPTLATSAPNGITFDSPEEIAAQAQSIRRVAVDTHAMPPANTTGMTDDERALLGAWIAQGASVERR